MDIVCSLLIRGTFTLINDKLVVGCEMCDWNCKICWLICDLYLLLWACSGIFLSNVHHYMYMYDIHRIRVYYFLHTPISWLSLIHPMIFLMPMLIHQAIWKIVDRYQIKVALQIHHKCHKININICGYPRILIYIVSSTLHHNPRFQPGDRLIRSLLILPLYGLAGCQIVIVWSEWNKAEVLMEGLI